MCWNENECLTKWLEMKIVKMAKNKRIVNRFSCSKFKTSWLIFFPFVSLWKLDRFNKFLSLSNRKPPHYDYFLHAFGEVEDLNAKNLRLGTFCKLYFFGFNTFVVPQFYSPSYFSHWTLFCIIHSPLTIYLCY